MIGSYMDRVTLKEYVISHGAALCSAAENLDSQWLHSRIVAQLLDDAQQLLQGMVSIEGALDRTTVYVRDRKTEKYTDWVEVMRLASFQYQRFSQSKRAKSEGLYASLLAQAVTWGKAEGYKRILVPGCGPGRSVLDFARAFPEAKVTGLDYSFLSLLLGQRIVCSKEGASLLRRDVYTGEKISQVLQIPGFGLNNANFCLCDLIGSELPSCDMIVCSNTLNLLSDHQLAVERLCATLEPGGLFIFADLIGWRLDREPRRKLLCSDKWIRTMFEAAALETLDQFSGVPYIESESDDQETVYNEHFYVGRKV